MGATTGVSTVLTDPVADMLTRIRNANQALQETVEMPNSRLKSDIAQLLKDEGYIDSFRVASGSSFDTLTVVLRFGENRERVINGLKRVSKPGRRIYARKERLPRVLGGMGTAVISTSKGIMSGRRAEELGIGGEVVCFVW
jgi:small subunit ribosomal protein S8